MKAGFIGAGKVGFSLGKFFSENRITVTGYYSRHEKSAREAAEFTKSQCYTEMETLIRESDAIFLTVPDGVINSIYEEIKKYDIKDKQICHCSGALSSEEAFPGIKERGAHGYSIHPLFPVSDKLNSYRELSGAFFCLEGSDEGISWWLDYFKENAKGSKLIEAKNKVKYHAACAIASNLYCALMQESMELMSQCGFTNEEALMAVTPLVESNVRHILEDGPLGALTGPVERGDAETVRKHLGCISAGVDRDLYIAASRKLTEVAQAKNPQRDYGILRECLDTSDAK